MEPCGSAICLRVVKLPPNPPATLDINNPDKKLRTRPLCGVRIGQGFHESSAGKLEGGRLYDPTSGKTYKGSIAVTGDKLKLRGYVGIAAFGRSEVWMRVAAPVKACGE